MVAATRDLLGERSAELITIRDVAEASGHHHRFVQAWFGGQGALLRVVFGALVYVVGWERGELWGRGWL